MRRVLVLLFAAVLVTAAAVPLTAGAAKKKRQTFVLTEKLVGAQISATEAVYKIKDSRLGKGAGVQAVKLNGLKGTDKETTYYKGATAKSHGSFVIGTPDANGVAPLTGKGKDTGGTGKLRGFKSTYTLKGTFNLKTSVFKATLKGTGSVLK